MTCRSSQASRSCCSAPEATARPTAQDWADAAGTIHYEIVTRIGPRVRRVYTGLDAVDGGGAPPGGGR